MGGEEKTLEVQGSYHSLITDGTGDYLTQLGDSTQEIATEAAIQNISQLANALLAGNTPNYTVVDATFTPTNATYDPLTGVLVLTIGAHSLNVGQYIEIEPASIRFTCASDGNQTPVDYPRTTDPAFQTKLEITAKAPTTITVNVGTSSETSLHTFVSATANSVTFGEYTAWTVSAYFPDDINETGGSGIVNFSRQEIISGDVQRTISQSDPLKGDEYFREIYLRECDRLAETLYVANYRRPEVRRYAFDRSGSEFIMAVPGPADTAVGSRITLSQEWR